MPSRPSSSPAAEARWPVPRFRRPRRPARGPVSNGEDGATVNEAGRENAEDKKKQAERSGDLQGAVLHDVMSAEADRVFAEVIDAHRARLLRTFDADATDSAPDDDR